MCENNRVIVIAEDDPDIAILICHELRKMTGWEVCSFPEGRAALQRLREGPSPAALVTDLHMPVMNGFALIEAVRAEPGLAQLPIVVFSASVDPVDEARCDRLGMNRFVRKSSPLPELRDHLREILGNLQGCQSGALAC